MVYGTYNELVTGANLNQLITGGPHIAYIDIIWYNLYWNILEPMCYFFHLEPIGYSLPAGFENKFVYRNWPPIFPLQWGKPMEGETIETGDDWGMAVIWRFHENHY